MLEDRKTRMIQIIPRGGRIPQRLTEKVKWEEKAVERHITGSIRIFPENDPSNLLYEEHNIICNTVKWLFAQLAAQAAPTFINTQGPQFGIWGLALGAGGSSPAWSPETQPEETPDQTALLQQLLRKQCSKIQYVDSNFNPVSGLSLNVDFQTVINGTTDNISQPIRELGLIGGGLQTFSGVPDPVSFVTTPVTNMLLAPYFDPNNPNPNTVTLINYKTLPPLPLPAGINLIFSWVLTF